MHCHLRPPVAVAPVGLVPGFKHEGTSPRTRKSRNAPAYKISGKSHALHSPTVAHLLVPLRKINLSDNYDLASRNYDLY